MAQLHIFPSAIAHNVTAIQNYLSMHAAGKTQKIAPKLWAVMKANAYGHELAWVLPVLEKVQGVAVTSREQVYECRRLGWKKPILYMGYNPSLESLFVKSLAPLHVMVSSFEQICALSQNPPLYPPFVWLRFAGALNYSGFQSKHYLQAFNLLQVLFGKGYISGIGHMQHYAYAEDKVELQQERQLFQQCIQGLPGEICTENSAALLLNPLFTMQTRWVRSGIALYGINPLESALPAGLDLRPAMQLKARIYAIQSVQAGQAVGYGGIFRASQTIRIGLVRCGYADGYPRQVQAGCPVSVHGQAVPLLGRVSMDTLSIDLSLCPQAQTGDWVVLWGDKHTDIKTIAQTANTIPAQLLTSITSRVKRVNAEAALVAPKA